jgi:hypothetical protein
VGACDSGGKDMVAAAGADRMRKGKKAVFYTVTALLLMSVFLFSFMSITKYKYSTRAFVIETRVNSINDFLGDAERDVERALYITSYRAMLSMTEQINLNQSYVDDVELRFNELFFNGTYDGETRNFIINNTFTLWEGRIVQKAADLGIVINFSDKSAAIMQDNPWNIKTMLNFTLYIGDTKGTANFTKNYSIESEVNIEFFEDPIYRIETNGIIIKPIVIENNTDFVQGSDTTNLWEHTEETRYVAFGEAPSYLKRLEGDLTADENGIESLVNVEELIINGVSIAGKEGKSIVDYIYFSGEDPTSYHVSGLDSWFRIDNESYGGTSHLLLYEVNSIIS